MPELALVILIMIAEDRKHQGTWRSKLYYLQVLEGTQHALESHREVVKEEPGHRFGALPLLGYKVGCLGLLKSTLLWLIKSTRAGIRTQEGRSDVTQAVSYLSCPGLSEKATFMGGGSLIPYQLFC